METIAAYIQNNPSLAIFAVFIGGLVSSASPCVLALVPLVVGYVGGYSQGNRRKALVYSLTFAAGLSITFTLMGAAAGFIGSIMMKTGSFFYWVIAIIAFIMGLSLLGLFEIRLPFRSKIQTKRSGLAGALLLGFLFGFLSTPCATPVLVVILAFIATKGQIWYGVLLLFVYAIGHCALIVLAGAVTGFVESFAQTKSAMAFSNISKKVSGVLIILASIYLLYLNI